MTLEEWAWMMFEQGRTKEPEFQTMVQFYGRDKFAKFWVNYKTKKADGTLKFAQTHTKAVDMVQEVFGPCEVTTQKK